jgi:tetratricopeptide (TPR) repeat protein
LELAADVEAFLSDDPVSAYQENFWEQSQRWLKRHRTLTTAGLVLLTTITIGSVVGALLINKEKGRTLQALSQVQNEKKKAEEANAKLEIALDAETEARRQTREMLNTVTDNVIGEMMARQLELTDSDRRFFDRVLEQFEQFTTSLTSTAEGENLKADGFLRVGNLQRSLRQIDEANRSYEQAIQLWQRLLEKDPQNVNYLRDLAAAQANLALNLESKDRQRAAELYASAAEILNNVLHGLAADSPVSLNADSNAPDVNSMVNLELARIQGNWANALVRLDRNQEAEEQYQNALNGFEALKQNAQTPAAIRDHARVLGNYATLQSREPARLADAASMIKEAIAILAEPVEEGKTIPPSQRFDRAIHTRNLGRLLVAQNEPEEASKAFLEGAEILKELTEEFPALTEYRNELEVFQNELFVADNNYANALRNAEQFDLAIPIYARQVRLLDEQLNPEDEGYSEKLLTTLYFYGQALVQSRDYETGLTIWTRLGEFRDNPNWQVFEIYRAMCLIRTGKTNEGLEAVDQVATASDLMPFQWIDFACCYAVAAELHHDDEQQVEQYRSQAMKHLRKAAESGFFETAEDKALMAGDSDLNSLKNYQPFIEYCKEFGIPLGEISNN